MKHQVGKSHPYANFYRKLPQKVTFRPQVDHLAFIGGGQLLRMAAQENRNKNLGLHITAIDTAGKNCPAAPFVDEIIEADYNNGADLERALRSLPKGTRITYEIERTPLQNDTHPLPPSIPSAQTVNLIRDKFLQRATLSKLGVMQPWYVSVKDSLGAAVAQLGSSLEDVIGKARRNGYDGRGVFLTPEKIIDAHAAGTPLFLEQRIAFDGEYSVMVARRGNEEVTMGPFFTYQDENAILRYARYPSGLSFKENAQAIALAKRAVSAFGDGLFGVELMKQDDVFYVNEIAPRTHNSAHGSFGGAFNVSQFELHLRLASGASLIQPELISGIGGVMMVNVLGAFNGEYESVVSPDVSYVDYGKQESRVGRKLGHYTQTALSSFELPSFEELENKHSVLLRPKISS